MDTVTILILIDGFLQYYFLVISVEWYCHNPYFNRWFSAIKKDGKKAKEALCHNPYFNRWFSAIWYP